MSCLLITEYLEGPSNNKGVEIKNCGAASLSLNGYVIGVAQNAATTPSTAIALTTTVTLASGQVYRVCNNSFTTTSEPGMASVCDQTSGSVNWTGDDRLALFKEANATTGYQTGTADILLDAFGEFAVRPATNIWGDSSIRRTSCGTYFGATAFPVPGAAGSAYAASVAYAAASASAGSPVAGISNFGVSTLTCP
jgi:predicted extracellular nuclease